MSASVAARPFFNVSGAIVFDSTPKTNEELKEEWQDVQKTADGVYKFSKPIAKFLWLFPFDIPGFTEEIAATAIAAVAFGTKILAEYKLARLDGKEYKLTLAEGAQATSLMSDLGGMVKKGRSGR